MLSTKPAQVMSQKTDIQKLYLESATVSGRQRVFFIGPFGRRVSFASQQRRAFNVVWAVGQTGMLDGNPRVAVVGGGIAGLTTSAALISRKCRVTLIEARDSVLERQTATNHRYVHPTVNFWPEKRMEPTTSFPYLDWYEGRCSDVIETIRDDWSKYFEGSLTRFLPRTQVSSVDSKDSQVKLTMKQNFAHPNETVREGMFDLVFITSGFGEESVLSDVDHSYWDRDGLEEARNAGTTDFLIAGTGDGGLIEALRLVQKDFKNGSICLRVIGDLDRHGLSIQVEKIETEAAERFRHDEVQAATFYESAYKALLDDIPQQTRNLLSSRHSGIRVRLAGSLPAPFGLWVAPVHKLMMAAALDAGAIEYIVGKVELKDGKYVIPAAVEDVQDVSDITRVVVRIGPRHPLSGFLKDSEIDMLRDAQRATADLLEPAAIDTDFFNSFAKHPRRDVADFAFVRFRKKIADEYLLRHFGVKSKLVVEGTPHYVIPFNEYDDGFTGSIPSQLFGIPLTSEAILTGAEI